MELFDSHRKKFLRRFSLLLPFMLSHSDQQHFFSSCVSFASDETLHKEQQALEQALENGAIRSYAMNGQYPESLDQILNDYHITYDRSRFVVEYTPKRFQPASLYKCNSAVRYCRTWKGGCQMKKKAYRQTSSC